MRDRTPYPGATTARLVGYGAASAGQLAALSMVCARMALRGARCPGRVRALLAPSSLAALTATFRDSAERNQAFGIFGAVAGSAGALLL